MGDVGDDYRMWREELKRRKEERHSINREKLKQIDIPYSIDNNGTVHFNTPKGKVLFYPSVNKYQHKKIVKLGSLESAINFAKSLGAK
ncbi:hypothetical protein [Xenorhabdus hominickii]|uniref:Uncharacterized protein n=1 Tax=Xenorhabdus hominickii TaxID=351679 RepID=A0A2G0QBC4_XENHO|nr:hypothetical protein [Xenorhabdus hominickii]AOM40532.1 hypothetical protein A9255_08000 [Xenorhabdus hominickii]PHM56522.1 hypothetical protein Xhom_02015 [Xenorhabdus hominickii]